MHVQKLPHKEWSALAKQADARKNERKAEILKGLAHPVRITIAEMLEKNELYACEVADNFSLDRTTVSKHLSLMTRLGILELRRDGQNIFYSLKMTCLLSVLRCVDALLEGDRAYEKN